MSSGSADASGLYFSNSDPHTPHLVFIGRWCPLHRGHVWIMSQEIARKNAPLLIMVRDTAQDAISANDRAAIIRAWMEHSAITGSIMIVPDVACVYYGRGVGYDIEESPVPPDIAAISATEIRKRMAAEDPSWKEYAVPGTEHIVAEKLSA